MKFDVTYNLTDLRRLAKKYPDIVAEETIAVLNLIVTRMESRTAEYAPKGVGGVAGLAGSIYGEVVSYGQRFKGMWGTPMEYGEVIEKGRRPGRAMPPVGPIALWAQRKLGVTIEESRSVGFAIAKKIALHGFEGAHMFEKAWNENERWAQDQLYGIAGRVVRRIEGGA